MRSYSIQTDWLPIFAPESSYDLNFISLFIEGPGGSTLNPLPMTFAQYQDFTGNDGDLLIAINREQNPLTDSFLFNFAIDDTAAGIVQYFTQQIVDDGNLIGQVLFNLRGSLVKTITQEPDDGGGEDLGLAFTVATAIGLGNFKNNLANYGITFSQPTDIPTGHDLYVQDTAANIEAATGIGLTPFLTLVQTGWTTFVSQDDSLVFNADQAEGIAGTYFAQQVSLTFQVPLGDYVQIKDSAENIETLSNLDIAYWVPFGQFSSIAPTIVSDEGSLEFNTDIARLWPMPGTAISSPSMCLTATRFRSWTPATQSMHWLPTPSRRWRRWSNSSPPKMAH